MMKGNNYKYHSPSCIFPVGESCRFIDTAVLYLKTNDKRIANLYVPLSTMHRTNHSNFNISKYIIRT